MPETNAQKYADAFKALTDSYERGGPDIDAKSLDEATKDLIIDLLAAQRGLDSTAQTTRKKLWSLAKKQMRGWDPNAPALAHPAKLLRLLAQTQDGSTSTYAEDLQGLRRAEESAKQSARARHPHKSDDFDRMLEGWVRRQPNISKAEVLERIRDAEGNGIVDQVDDQFIAIRPYPDADIKTIKISGLGPRLTGIRNNIKNKT